MIVFLIRRLMWLLLTLWIVFTLSFVLMRAVPGGPFSQERQLPAAVIEKWNERYNLNDPPLQQYWDRLREAAVGDLGFSMKLQDYTVNEVIAQGFPVSASLGILALVLALSIGVTAGVVSAIFRQSVLDVSVRTFATVGIAVPNFVLASLGILVFVFWLGWLPAAGWGSTAQVLQPALWLGLPFAAYISRLTRTGMLDVLGRDYIRTAYAKGIAPRRVILRHALRGALLPVVSYLGPATAGILTGSLVLEQIFALPGMGSHFIQAAFGRDYTLAMGMVLVYTVLLYSMNTLVDLSYGLLDPRVKLSNK